MAEQARRATAATSGAEARSATEARNALATAWARARGGAIDDNDPGTVGPGAPVVPSADAIKNFVMSPEFLMYAGKDQAAMMETLKKITAPQERKLHNAPEGSAVYDLQSESNRPIYTVPKEKPNAEGVILAEDAKQQSKHAAEILGKISEQGRSAQQEKVLLDDLERGLKMVPDLTGYEAKFKSFAAGLGIDVKNRTAIDLINTTLDRLTPGMRVPGSGATSDREMAVFRNSLPELHKTPEGRKIILETMKGLADHKIESGRIADGYLSGRITRPRAFDELAALPNPTARFSEENQTKEQVRTINRVTDPRQLDELYRTQGHTEEVRRAIRARAEELAAKARSMRRGQ